MKTLKTLGLVALLAAILTLAFGASSASATVFCKVFKPTCGTEDYASGTEFKATLMGASIKFNTIWTTVDCTTVVVQGPTTSTGGGAGVKVPITLNTLTFDNCHCNSGGGGVAEVITKAKGSLTVEVTENGDGTIKGSNSNLTILCKPINTSCNYGTTTNTDLGKLIGWANAWIELENAGLSRIAEDGSLMICGAGATMSGKFEVNEPAPLYVITS